MQNFFSAEPGSNMTGRLHWEVDCKQEAKSATATSSALSISGWPTKFFLSASNSWNTFVSLSIRPSAKNLDHLYRLINHPRIMPDPSTMSSIIRWLLIQRERQMQKQMQRHMKFQEDSAKVYPVFRSARTSWNTFVRPSVRPWAQKIWINCTAL